MHYHVVSRLVRHSGRPSGGGIAALLFFIVVSGALYADTGAVETSVNGIPCFHLESPYQARSTTIEVLTPVPMDPGKRYPVLYLLPVNDGLMNAWGSGIVEARRHDIANRFQVICVSPEYDYTPWYGDHPTEKTLAQESYLLKAVIPEVEARYPVAEGAAGRYLIGFSKSGFGALSIALRHIGLIGGAAVWDAPVMMDTYFPGEEEMVRVFQTNANFIGYAIPGLVTTHREALRGGRLRIALMSNANPNDSISRLHALLEENGIPHRYRVDEKRAHTWTSEWLPGLVEMLLRSDSPG
jgi:enterochelin esterase-like enzyme